MEEESQPQETPDEIELKFQAAYENLGRDVMTLDELLETMDFLYTSLTKAFVKKAVKEHFEEEKEEFSCSEALALYRDKFVFTLEEKIEHYKEAFAAIDTSENGYIEKEELRKFLEDAEEYDPETFDEVYDDINKNKEDGITVDELIAAFVNE